MHPKLQRETIEDGVATQFPDALRAELRDTLEKFLDARLRWRLARSYCRIALLGTVISATVLILLLINGMSHLELPSLLFLSLVLISIAITIVQIKKARKWQLSMFHELASLAALNVVPDTRLHGWVTYRSSATDALTFKP